MKSKSIGWDHPRTEGWRARSARIALAFAALWLLAACGKLEQPPFEVRNELDQLVVDFFSPPERGKYREIVAEREARGGVVGATGQFLLESFPKGTPVNRVTEYFEGIGGTCRAAEDIGDSVICEYCRNRNLAWRYIIDTSYRTTEILWVVEAFGESPSGTTEAYSVTSALAYTVAVSTRSSSGHSGPAPIPGTCDDARYRLENRLYDERSGELQVRQWVYEQVD